MGMCGIMWIVCGKRVAVPGLDHGSGQPWSVHTAEPKLKPRSVGSAVRTSGGVAGIRITTAAPSVAESLYQDRGQT